MLRRSQLPPLSELPTFEDDPALFDPSPEWFLPGLKPSLREDAEEEDDGLGLRSLLEQPEALSKAWRTTGRELAGNRVRRPKPRRSGRSPRWSDVGPHDVHASRSADLLRVRIARKMPRVSSDVRIK